MDDNKRTINIDEYIAWYNDTYANWADDCSKNASRVLAFYNLFAQKVVANNDAVSDGN